MNKIAIMQPYIFPYLGYFQLIHACDKFIFYDDVNFINKGWINRNRILDKQCKPLTFTVPLSDASQNKLIKDILIQENYSYWKNKFLQTLYHNYSKAPHFKIGYAYVENILNTIVTIWDDPSFSAYSSISVLAKNSIVGILNYISDYKLNVTYKDSTSYNNQHLKAQERILDICKQENATTYVNLSGGKSLYNAQDFKKENIQLFFHKMKPIEYKQFDYPFIPNLSIIDALMFCSKQQLQDLLQQYELEEASV